MVDLRTRMLTRQQINDFVKSPRGILAFEDVQADLTTQNDAISKASFIVVSSEPSLGSERALVPVAGQLSATDGGANGNYTLGLADTAVTAGSYGDASHTVKVTVDAKGRLTGAVSYALSTDNVAEGGSLYFTTARARGAVSNGTGITYAAGVFALDTAFTDARYASSSTPTLPIRTITVSNGIGVSDYTLICDATAGPMTVTLPAAASSIGRVCCIKKVDATANAVTIDPNAAETIDLAATVAITTRWVSVTLHCDGTAWYIIGRA